MAQIRTRVSVSKTLDEMTESEVLAMALDDMEFLGLIKWKPAADEKPSFNENREAHDRQHASSGLALAEHDLHASPAKLRSLNEQVRQLLEQAAPKAESIR